MATSRDPSISRTIPFLIRRVCPAQLGGHLHGCPEYDDTVIESFVFRGYNNPRGQDQMLRETCLVSKPERIFELCRCGCRPVACSILSVVRR